MDTLIIFLYDSIGNAFNKYPVLGVAWLFFVLYRLLDKKPDPEIDESRPTEATRYIEFISCGKKIIDSHLCYYHYLIKMDEKREINNHTIERSAQRARMWAAGMKNKREKRELMEQIDAAEIYLKDRWFYVNSLN